MSRRRCRFAMPALDRLCKKKRPALSFVAVALLSCVPAFADITSVSVSGFATGSGTLGFACPTSPACNVSAPPFSFFGTNTSLGTFSTSGGTSGLDPFDNNSDTVSGKAQQVTTATADSFSIDLMESASSSDESFFVDIHGGWNVSILNDLTLSFDLTTTSVLQLTACGGGPAELFCQLSDSEGNVILTLPTAGTTDVVLPAGMYSLLYTSTFEAGGLPGETGFSADNTLSAELVPEPSKAAFLPVSILLFVLGLRAWFVSRLRTTPAME